MTSGKTRKPAGRVPATTGIGSLPHHNIDAALAFSFQLGIPFLPQIPIRNPWEFMIAQALEGMPGLEVERDGAVSLDVNVWTGRTHAFNERLLNAFAHMASPDAFESFEPSAATSSGWQPFLFELGEREVKLAKVQIAGPMTAQWALRLNDGTNISKHPEMSTQIYRLVLARALAMTRRLRADGVQPLIYLDEPGLYGFTPNDPVHALGLRELKLVIQAIHKEGGWVGLHCCSNTDWSAVLELGLSVISLDTHLSLKPFLEQGGPKLEQFVAGGGRLSLGVIPTARSADGSQISRVSELFADLLDAFADSWKGKPETVRKIMAEAIYTPACGLALHSIGDAENILGSLIEFERFCMQSLAGAPQLVV